MDKRKSTIIINPTLPLIAGVATSIAGGSAEASALVGAGIVAIEPLVRAIATATTANKVLDKKTMQRINALNLKITTFSALIGAGASAGSHQTTEIVKNILSPETSMQQPFQPKNPEQPPNVYQFELGQ